MKKRKTNTLIHLRHYTPVVVEIASVVVSVTIIVAKETYRVVSVIEPVVKNLHP